tara:strand:+ start:2164 stop:2502 length:339 start_codon:yes stop_codon:yes gene_type:complete
MKKLKIHKYKPLKLINNKVFNMSFLQHDGFISMTPDARDLLMMIVTLLNDAHQDEMHNNSDIRSLLINYSPNNKLLESSDPISWGQGFQHLIIDIIMGEDITSPTYKCRTKH